MDEIVKDSLIESNENLDRLDQELVKLESEPSSKELLASVFRTIHAIKGSCGFLSFARLEKLAHAGESLLSRLRDGKLGLSAEITSGVLAMVDAVRRMAAIQASGQDGEEDNAPLIDRSGRLSYGGEPGRRGRRPQDSSRPEGEFLPSVSSMSSFPRSRASTEPERWLWC
jgi:two-component system, chemotaxis family, sensor kinase CheA